MAMSPASGDMAMDPADVWWLVELVVEVDVDPVPHPG
jgi:hypothetical protein